MTAISWNGQVSGDWTDAADWSSGTVPTWSDDVTIGQFFFGIGYLVTITDDEYANSLTFNAPGLYYGGAELLENAGSLTLFNGPLEVDGGLVALNRANSLAGGVLLQGGVLSVGNSGALGTGGLGIDGGELLGTADVTLANHISLSNNFWPASIAAAHGTTLDIGSGGWDLEYDNLSPDFGAPGEDGTVVLHVPYINTSGGAGGPGQSEIRTGTVKAGDANVGELLQDPIVDWGATLDLAGFNATLYGLQGAGTVTNSGGGATLTLNGDAKFSGSITGPISLVVDTLNVTLTGVNTYTGNTTIGVQSQSGGGIGGAALTIGTGGSIGSGAIDNEGGLIIDSSDDVTLNNTIAGPGYVTQEGSGKSSINGVNSYAAGTNLEAGTLAIGNAKALGGGTLTMTGGELLGTANETIANNTVLNGSVTIAAAHGTTLAIGSGGLQLTQAANDTYVFGALGQDGTVLLDASAPGYSDNAQGTTEVRYGTLMMVNADFGGLPTPGRQFIVDAGATLDLSGSGNSYHFPVFNLTGAGTVTNTGDPVDLYTSGINFSGTLSGGLTLILQGSALLSGLSEYTGDTEIDRAATLTNTGTFDLTTNSGINTYNDPTTAFINDGVFEKTGGDGTSTVQAPFTNNGTLTVTSGSIQFTGGFTNRGTIQGAVSESGGLWTISASTGNSAQPAATTADMTMHNGATGAFEIYDIGHNTILAADALSQFGSEWQLAGLGSFDGTDTTDMLLRDNTGAFLVNDINGNNAVGAAYLGQVGMEWSVAGFGAFSSRSGETDMLMRNSNTGQFEIYDISNNTITFAAPMGQVGLEWSVAGFGDFSTRPNETDMLMRNTHTGQFEIYDISNNQLTSAAPMGQVGLEWSVAGFGDFSGRANETDMLMRNNNTGQFEIYDISNSQLTSAAPMGQVGLEWSVVGFGNFSGNANESDMLMRNTHTGQFEVYDITNNQLTSAASMGQVGLEWQNAGIASNPTGGFAAADAQLTQAMASFAPSGGAADMGAPDAQTLAPTAVPTLAANSAGLAAGTKPAPAISS